MKNDDGLDFALSRDNGRIVDVTMVSRGLACRCICPACGSQLVARKGRKYRHHFAHLGAGGVVPDCGTGKESSLHRAAQQIIADWKIIELPQLRVEGAGRVAVVPGRTLQIVRSELADQKGGRRAWLGKGFRPDVILHGADEQVWCEVRVTHAVDDRKRAKLSRAKVATLEYDLSGLYRSGGNTLETLEELLRHDPTICQWVFHPAEEELRGRLLSGLADQQVVPATASNSQATIGYGPDDGTERVGLNRFGFEQLVPHPRLGLIPRDPTERAEYLAKAYPEPRRYRLPQATAYLRHHPHGDSTCLVTFGEGRTGEYEALLSEYARSSNLRCSYFGVPDARQVSGERCFEKLDCFLRGLSGQWGKV